MYDYLGSFQYNRKKPLTRRVACEVAIETLEGIAAAVTNIDSGEIHDVEREERRAGGD